ncbi:hypothetical protein ACHAWF_014586 [Thalassiosira exigua]
MTSEKKSVATAHTAVPTPKPVEIAPPPTQTQLAASGFNDEKATKLEPAAPAPQPIEIAPPPSQAQLAASSFNEENSKHRRGGYGVEFLSNEEELGEQASDFNDDSSYPSSPPVLMTARSERRRSSHGPAVLHATLVEAEVFDAVVVSHHDVEEPEEENEGGKEEKPWWKRQVLRGTMAGLALAVLILVVVLTVRDRTGDKKSTEGATMSTNASQAEEACEPSAELVGPLIKDERCVGCGPTMSGAGDNAAFASSGSLIKVLSNLDDEYRYAESTLDLGVLNVTSVYDVGEIAISGDTLVVGVPNERNDTGSIYVFDRNPLDGSWATAPLRISSMDTKAGSRFGSTVKINGNLVAIGAPEDRTVYLYRRFGNIWYEDGRVNGTGILAMKNGVALGVSDTDDEGNNIVLLYLHNPGRNTWMMRHTLRNNDCHGRFGHEMRFPTEKSLLIGCLNQGEGAVYYYTLPGRGRRPTTQGDEGEEGLPLQGGNEQGPPRDGPPPDGGWPSGPKPGPPPEFELKQTINLMFLEGSNAYITDSGFVGGSFSVWDNILIVGGTRPTNRRVYVLSLSPDGLWTKTMVVDSFDVNAANFGIETHVYKDKMLITSRTESYLYDLKLCKNESGSEERYT